MIYCSHVAAPYYFKLLDTITMQPNTEYSLLILSTSFGIDNDDGVKTGKGPDLQDKKGLTDNIYITDNNDKTVIDLKANIWKHYIGLTGEYLISNSIPIPWNTDIITGKPGSWYKTTFPTPNDNILDSGVILVDIGTNGMKSGHYYINKMDMGHYNHIKYIDMVQQYYYIPKGILTPNQGINELLFFDEQYMPNITNINVVLSSLIIP